MDLSSSPETPKRWDDRSQDNMRHNRPSIGFMVEATVLAFLMLFAGLSFLWSLLGV